MANKFMLDRGKQNPVPWVASGDVQCGDFVVMNGGTGAGLKGGVAIRDTKDGEQAELDIGPMSVYRCKVDGAYALGAALYSDGTDTLTGSGDLFGYAVEASTGAGQTIRVSLNPVIAPTAV